MRRLILLLVLLVFASAPAFAADPIPVRKTKTKTGIAWSVTPPVAVIYLNGKKLGAAGDVKFTKARPGRHTIKLTKGGDEAEFEVKVNKGQVLKFHYDFSE